MKPFQILSLGETQTALNSALQRLPADKYRITQITEQQDYLESASEQHADLALLNIFSADDPATQLCEQLKKNKTTKRIPVIIGLDSDDLHDIIECYEVGAFDVISHKLDPDEIQQRITLAIYNYHQTIQLEEKAKKAKQAAFDAMEDANKLGCIIEFMGKSIHCAHFIDLAKMTFEVFENLEIHGSILLHARQKDYFFSDDGDEKPLEMQIMQKYKAHVEEGDNTTGRFKTFSNRILVASEYASILVRNAPESEKEAGRLRDLLGALINVLDARSSHIVTAEAHTRKIELTRELIASTKQAMDELETLFHYNETETTAVMDTLLQDTNQGLMTLCLTEEQEGYFITLLDTAMARLTGLYTQNIMIDRHFDKIITSLTKLSKEI